MNDSSSVVVKTLAGRIDRDQIAAFRRGMQELLRRDQPRVVFDFGSVTQLDSSGVEFLLDCLSSIVRRDGELKLAALSTQAATVLEITRVGRLFEIFPTVEDAVRSFDSFLPKASGFPEPWDLFRTESNRPGTAENLTQSTRRRA
jgi:anti-sigma B factor antagonist